MSGSSRNDYLCALPYGSAKVVAGRENKLSHVVVNVYCGHREGIKAEGGAALGRQYPQHTTVRKQSIASCDVCAV